jgi:hypothetical protein
MFQVLVDIVCRGQLPVNDWAPLLQNRRGFTAEGAEGAERERVEKREREKERKIERNLGCLFLSDLSRLPRS